VSCTDVPDPSDYWSTFERRLAELGCQPVVIGALAALEYRATPRLTTDVDFLVRSLEGVAEAFAADGFDVQVMAEPGEAPYIVYIRGKGVKVDALLAETEYQRVAHSRASAGLLTVEDVLVHKLIAWRARDQDDIASILSTRPVLDRPYIDHWAGEWEVSDRWSESRQRWSQE
jgi:hypothetical protein